MAFALGQGPVSGSCGSGHGGARAGQAVALADGCRSHRGRCQPPDGPTGSDTPLRSGRVVDLDAGCRVVVAACAGDDSEPCAHGRGRGIDFDFRFGLDFSVVAVAAQVGAIEPAPLMRIERDPSRGKRHAVTVRSTGIGELAYSAASDFFARLRLARFASTGPR